MNSLITNQTIRLTSNFLISLSILLLTINLIGLFHFTSIDSAHSQANNLIEIRNPQTLSEKQFWQQAYKYPHEEINTYLPRLMTLINNRLIHIDSVHLKPTFFENWIMWRYARKKGWYEWTDTKKAVRAGGGYCSQHAIVLNNILREQNIESHIVGLNGHVLNEALINGSWRILDPDYNVIHKHSLHELEINPGLARETYLNEGWPIETAKLIESLFATSEDNWHYKTSRSWGDKRAFKEAISLYLIWLIPLLSLLLGYTLKLSFKPS